MGPADQYQDSIMVRPTEARVKTRTARLNEVTTPNSHKELHYLVTGLEAEHREAEQVCRRARIHLESTDQTRLACSELQAIATIDR